ncbi:hypothetical protein BpHYR1_015083 [Brachionus plicatilis]|uniref:Uncharacterized protein n=1 Tax=Brachionus plicatilis TaxID=10195 RepID=A0A3M7QAW3_BRAPC|nr:hypothetical protein BpHYR1_015083 [Brachionus plicatilis]
MISVDFEYVPTTKGYPMIFLVVDLYRANAPSDKLIFNFYLNLNYLKAFYINALKKPNIDGTTTWRCC